MISSKGSNILALIFYNFSPSLPVRGTKNQKLASAPEFVLYGSAWDHIITTIILLQCSFQFFVVYVKLLLVKISILFVFLKFFLG